MDIDSGIEASQKKTRYYSSELDKDGTGWIRPASFMAFNSTGRSSYGHWESLGHVHTVQFDCKYKFWAIYSSHLYSARIFT
jgi:hypothetical protein